MIRGFSNVAVVAAGLVLASCAGEPSGRQYATSVLAPNINHLSDLHYVNPNAALKTYTKFILDPVAIYSGSDATFGGTSADDRKAVADFIGQEFSRTLQARYQIVAAAGPGVARVHLTLVGLEIATPVSTTIAHLAPAGVVANAKNSTPGPQGLFIGSATFAAEFYDAMTNELLAAFVTKRGPNALDVMTLFTDLNAARPGVARSPVIRVAATDEIPLRSSSRALRSFLEELERKPNAMVLGR
jgi:hypothetical protein